MAPSSCGTSKRANNRKRCTRKASRPSDRASSVQMVPLSQAETTADAFASGRRTKLCSTHCITTRRPSTRWPSHTIRPFCCLAARPVMYDSLASIMVWNTWSHIVRWTMRTIWAFCRQISVKLFNLTVSVLTFPWDRIEIYKLKNSFTKFKRKIYWNKVATKFFRRLLIL